MLRARFWTNFDLILFAVALLLTAIGVLVLYSTTFKVVEMADPVNPTSQVVFAVIGLAALLLAAQLDYRVWAKMTGWLYVLMLGLLGLVMVAGKNALGATRWIDLGLFQFQPSEVAKLMLIIIMAKFFSDHYDQMDQPKYLVLSALMVAPPVVMVLLQPDLGTALVIVVIWLAMLLMSPVRRSLLLLAGGVMAALMPVLVTFLKPYQQQRLNTFLNPMADPLHTGYNVKQSTIAVGSGQWTGRGLASGSQSQLNFLPSQHTDFIFAVLSEKMGFVGAMLVLVLFGVLMLRGLVIAHRARDRFGMFLAVGILAMLLFHLFINIGMNMGIMPVTGIPLPFVSAGGTSLLVSLAAIGLLESVAVRHKKIQFGA